MWSVISGNGFRWRFVDCCNDFIVIIIVDVKGVVVDYRIICFLLVIKKINMYLVCYFWLYLVSILKFKYVVKKNWMLSNMCVDLVRVFFRKG